jgi:uncharacterized protein YecE (DUF72 family)
MNIYVGTCGFSYQEWEGTFYPPALPLRDRLTYYAERFRAVELDFSFYHLPEATNLEKMIRRTRKEFRFLIKAHRSLTHADNLSENALEEFREAISPLTRSRRLGAVLAQFPASFCCTREAVRHLRTLREGLADTPLAIEFRHVSWDRPQTLAFLEKYGIALCLTDSLQEERLPLPPLPRTADFLYLRMGRWETAELQSAPTDSGEESPLDSWAQRIEEEAETAEAVYVLFNDIRQANAPKRARMLAQRLGMPVFRSVMKRGRQTQLALR